MADDAEGLVYGFKPEDWARLPEWLQTFVIESNERNAHAYHSAHRNASQTLQDQAWKTSDFVLKTLVTVEGGSLVAILAFLGSLTQRRSELDIVPLLIALGGLGAGLLLAIVAAFCTYLVAAYFAAGHDHREISLIAPYIRATPKGDAYDRRGEKIRFWAIGFAVGSLVAAGSGIAAFGVFTARALDVNEQAPPTSPVEVVRSIQSLGKTSPSAQAPVDASGSRRSSIPTAAELAATDRQR